MQDTCKINNGWGERTDFFRLKKAVLLFKMISLAEQVTHINICPGEISTVPTLPPCLPAVDGVGASGARCFPCPLSGNPYMRWDWNPSFLYHGFFSPYENLQFPPLDVKCMRTCWLPTALSYTTEQKFCIWWGYRSWKGLSQTTETWIICTAWTEAEVGSWTVCLAGRVSERNVRAQAACTHLGEK